MSCISKASILMFALSLTSVAAAVPIAALKSDMGANERTLLGGTTVAKWTKGAFMPMGNNPKGSASPVWWQPANQNYKSNEYWNGITPWFVLYPAINHYSTNTSVKLSNIRLYLYSKSEQRWKQVNSGFETVSWASFYQLGLINKTSPIKVPAAKDGGVTLAVRNTEPIHGGVRKFEMKGSDVGGVFAYIESQLVVTNPALPDDRSSAQLVLSIGSDYYPTVTTQISDFAPMGYVPAVGASRFGLLGKTKRKHYFSTVNLDNCDSDPACVKLKELVIK